MRLSSASSAARAASAVICSYAAMQSSSFFCISASSFSSYIKSTATEVSELPDYDVSVYLEDEAEHLAGEIAAVEGVDAALDTAWVYAKALVDPKAMTEEARGMYTPEGISSPGSEDSPYFLSEDGRAVLSVNLLVLKDADYEEWLAQQGVRQQTVNEGAPYSAAAYNQMKWYDWSEQRYKRRGRRLSWCLRIQKAGMRPYQRQRKRELPARMCGKRIISGRYGLLQTSL